MIESMKIKDLARILNGVPGDFQVWVNGVHVHYGQKLVELEMIPKAQPPPRDNFGQKIAPPRDKFFPNEAGWTEENEYYYNKWKNGGNDLTYIEELEEIDRLKSKRIEKDDIGSNTIKTE